MPPIKTNKTSRRDTQRQERMSGHYANLADAVTCNDIARQQAVIKAAEADRSDAQGNTLMHLAAQRGHNKVIRLLADKGYSVNAINVKNETPLHIADECYDRCAVAALIELGSNINAQDHGGNTPLHRFCKTEWVEGALEVIKAKPDLTIRNQDDDTVFMTAVSWRFDNRENLLRKLIKAGSDIHQKRADGLAAINLAIINNAPKAVEILMDLGARIEHSTQSPVYHPLHYAALHGAADVTRMLINKEHDVNMTIEHGRTPLHIAFMCDHERFSDKTVRLLILAGADLKSKDSNNMTPIEYLDKSLHQWFMPQYQEMARISLAESLANGEFPEASTRKTRRI